jgi:hypothetical protein
MLPVQPLDLVLWPKAGEAAGDKHVRADEPPLVHTVSFRDCAKICADFLETFLETFYPQIPVLAPFYPFSGVPRCAARSPKLQLFQGV